MIESFLLSKLDYFILHLKLTLVPADLYSKQWKEPSSEEKYIQPRIFHIMASSPTFGNYYDEVQDLLKSLAGFDEFLQGIYELS